MATQQELHGRSTHDGSMPEAAFTPDEVAAMVVDARARVTGSAGRHPRFAGLSEHDVEELFDATSEVIIGRAERFQNADHVRASLWTGMELRARDVFRRRRRRGFELGNEALELVPDDLGDHEDRIDLEHELLVVRDFLAAMTPREADVWKLVHGEELSVAQTAKQLGISRHATNEHLEAAVRKLEVFLAIRRAGQWCGRRRSDIVRFVDGSDDEGTARRALAHLQACGVCRREYAAQVRSTGRLAAGVLPLPALGSSEHGRTIVERLADLLPFGSGGGGRTEIIGSALLGGGGGLAGVAKVGAVVATTATVAVGAGAVAERPQRESRPPAVPRAAAPSAGANAAPAPIAAVVRAPTPAPGPRSAARKTLSRSTTSTASAKRRTARAVARQRAAERREDVFELGTIESTGTAPATGTAASASAPAPVSPKAPAREPQGQESFLP